MTIRGNGIIVTSKERLSFPFKARDFLFSGGLSECHLAAITAISQDRPGGGHF